MTKELEKKFEMIFIDKEGKTNTIYKEDLNKTYTVNNEEIYITNHYDTIYYFIKQNNLTDEETSKKLRQKNNYIEYAKVLLKNNYIIINNITYYGIIEKKELDLLILSKDDNITDQQIKKLEELEPLFNNIKTNILYSKINLKTNQTYEKSIENIDKLLNEILEEKEVKKRW